MRYIRITIQPDGSTKLEALGYEDHSCHLATKKIEQALGTPTWREPTATNHTPTTNTLTNKD